MAVTYTEVEEEVEEEVLAKEIREKLWCGLVEFGSVQPVRLPRAFRGASDKQRTVN